jgi:hypothetical protein
MLKSIWKDPVWSAVIATVIATVGGAVGTFLLGLWPAIGGWLVELWAFGARPSKVANWVVWLLFLLTVPTLLIFAALAWEAIHPNREMAVAEGWRTYTEDEFLGLRWRWKYFSSGKLEDPIPFCPACDYQVFPHHASAYNVIERIGFHCDSCGRNSPEFDESFESLRSKIERFVQQKIRTDAARSKNAI